MMKKETIILYNDSPVFGGHEILTAEIANTISTFQDKRIIFYYYHDNFEELLCSEIIKKKLPFSATTPLPLRDVFRVKQIKYLVNEFKQNQPRFVWVSQGNIEFGIKGLIAGKKAGFPVYSYIPLVAFSHSANLNFFNLIRNFIDLFVYKSVDQFVTCSEYQKNLLTGKSGKKNVRILFNKIDPRIIKERTNNIEIQTIKNIGIIGRVYFKQKNQNILIDVANKLQEQNFKSIKFHVIGDGPDLHKLKHEAKKMKVSEYFIFYGFMDRGKLLSIIEKEIDLILIPSHFEGAPLILDETLALGKPFIISDAPFIQGYDIPNEWKFNNKNPEEIAEKIIHFPELFDFKKYTYLRNKILQRHSEKNFVNTLADIVGQND